MVGISKGSRKFVIQKALFNWDSKIANGGAPQPVFNDFANEGDWNLLQLSTNTNDPIPALVWNTTKMDCRAFNQGGKGLQLINATVQENGPVFQQTGVPVQTDSGEVQFTDPKPLLVYDILTTEEMNLNSIWEAAYLFSTPSFLSFGEYGNYPVSDQDSTDFNPSMVIYGMWRYFQKNADRTEGLTVLQAGQFGMGEVIVAPHVYWTRLFYIEDIRSNQQNQQVGVPDKKNFVTIPASNLLLSGEIVDLSTGEELAQMARATMR